MPPGLLGLHARRQVKAHHQIGRAVDVPAAKPRGRELCTGVFGIVSVLVDHASHPLHDHVDRGRLPGTDRRIPQPYGYPMVALALIVRVDAIDWPAIHVAPDVRCPVVAVGQAHVHRGNVGVARIGGEGKPVLQRDRPVLVDPYVHDFLVQGERVLLSQGGERHTEEDGQRDNQKEYNQRLFPSHRIPPSRTSLRPHHFGSSTI
jgi:hypothetical protein